MIDPDKLLKRLDPGQRAAAQPDDHVWLGASAGTGKTQVLSARVLRLMLEVAATKFSEKTWAQMTGLPFVTTEDFQSAQMIAMAAQQAGMQVDEQTQAKLQMPVWGQILELLRNDLQRAYRIDIESNSTIEPEAAEDQEQIAALMNALAQYLNGVSPLVQSLAGSIYDALVRLLRYL